jgi:hypothetical protein
VTPGTLGMAELTTLAGPTLEQRRNQHRPIDQAAIAAEVRRLHGSGLTAHDIAGALRLSFADVLRVIAGTSGGPVRLP